MMHMTRLENLDQLVEIQPEWDQLLEDSLNSSVFMTWEWLYTWWEVYGKGQPLWWLCVRDETGRLVASAPLYVKQKQEGAWLPQRELRMVGTGANVSPEHLDILVDPLHLEAGIQAIGDYLSDRFSEWDRLHLSDLTKLSANAYRLADELFGKGAASIIEEQDPPAPAIRLPETWPEYFESLSRKMRANIARHRRKAEREMQAHFRVWTPGDEPLEKAFAAFEKLFAGRKLSVGIGNKFEEAEGYREFHHKAAGRFAKRGWLYLALLESGHEIIAAEYNYVYRGILSSYQFGFDPRYAKRNVFKVLRSCVIEDAISKGVDEFDLLRGDEAYKQDWNAVAKSKHQLRCFSPTFFGRALMTLSSLRGAVSKFATKQSVQPSLRDDGRAQPSLRDGAQSESKQSAQPSLRDSVQSGSKQSTQPSLRDSVQGGSKQSG